MQVKIFLPNSAFLGNIDPLLRGFDPSDTAVLEIGANKKWISVHPVVLSMVAALGLIVHPSNMRCEKLEAGREITLDFEHIDSATQSFIHALISELFRQYGSEILDKINFKHCR